MTEDNDAQAESGEAPAPDPARAECSACRGTGQVISNLGGEPKQVPCPWCEGSGRFIPGHDAQHRDKDPGGDSAA